MYRYCLLLPFFLLSLGCNFQLPPVGPIFRDKNEVFIWSVLHTERSPAWLQHGSTALQALRCSVPVWRSRWRLGDKWQLYLCVLHESIKHWPLKMLPRYLRLSATGSWYQIGMLLRQSRTTHPLVSPVMCVTACAEEVACFIQLQMYTLNSCWCAGNGESYLKCVSSSISKTWCFNAACQVVYIQ